MNIELAGVSKTYGKVVALHDINLSIESGKFVTLLGPSGSGKTTTMRIIAGLERQTAGSVSIGGKLVSDDRHFQPVHRRNLGMVFQSYAVWPHKTVAENVAFPLQQRGIKGAEQRTRVNAVLEQVGLSAYGERYPSQLSGGQQQRVSLARAIVAQPDVILYDEPLSNLDAKLRDSMRELLYDLHRKLGTTSIYVTHDQVEAMVLSDLIHVMREGRIVQSGTPEQLYHQPADRFIATFVGAANVLAVAQVDAAEGTVRLKSGEIFEFSGDSSAASGGMMFRPHEAAFVSEHGIRNTLKAKVKSVHFLGDRIRYTLASESGEMLVVERLPQEGRAAVGEMVDVSVPKLYCRIVDRSIDEDQA